MGFLNHIFLTFLKQTNQRTSKSIVINLTESVFTIPMISWSRDEEMRKSIFIFDPIWPNTQKVLH